MKTLRVICSITFLCSGASPAELKGRVQDPTSHAVSGTLIELVAEHTAVSKTYSDDEGRYSLTGVPAGNYTLKLSQAGFKNLTVEAIHLVEGRRISVPDLQLKVGGCPGLFETNTFRLLEHSDGSGIVSGTVTIAGHAGRSIERAKVRLRRDGRIVSETHTDSAGRFSFANLEPRTFRIEAERPGFRQFEEMVEAKAGLDSIYHISLKRWRLWSRFRREPLPMCE
ncbi:MAG: carboxypeptidase regulatory-like domain-containing protein [Bryobacterales bacterium]|nr:carboxypeptidase regulatory-like domain-containing protein [Bryobacterales bacterium]